ncbi:MAG: 2-isopropylmalate synthase [Candidatus Argoarchaeum ethanivorans]|uniref:Probable 2-isopropylmalate synthase n=1 Tax=Candidatus Argoarchaeum ethanivorans TaxID=2608793 RepID=A0A811TD44_9EURY|nr:MAG: 2-isopropylmalate synthase [Candidatus Argoarchaeum ethanivorans]
MIAIQGGIIFYFNQSLKRRNINIFDTTLRDGEQTPGVSLTIEEKLRIAEQLDKLGVNVIEAGFPSSSEWEMKAIKQITASNPGADICGLARVIKDDIDACIRCDVDMVHTFVSTSDVQRIYTIKKSQDEVCGMAVEAVQYIKDHGVKCMFSAMDATRTELSYLKRIFTEVESAGCDIINVPDTVGVIVPSEMYQLIRSLHSEIHIPLDVHCHNDFGLASANSLAACEAGASQVQVTINGLGERAGNADLSQVVMSLQCMYDVRTSINTEYLFETSKMVEGFTGVKIPITMPVVGENAFAHESGIHTHGVLMQSDTFEPGIMTPEMVGQKRRIVLGKHAGRHAVDQTLKNAGIHPTEEQLKEIILRIKNIASKGKNVTDSDLFAVADTIMGKGSKREQAITLKEVSVMTGNIITPTAAVKAIIDGEEHIEANTGVGPVDAALGTLESMLGERFKVKIRDFKIAAISGGSDALAEVIIGVEDENGRTVTARAAREDIVMASVEAFVTGINRLLSIDR